LAKELKAYIVMPDFFEPADPWPVDNFPPKTDEDKKKLQEFFGGPANPSKSVDKLKNVAEQLRKDGATKVGTFGFCWVRSSMSSPLWTTNHPLFFLFVRVER
jgi:dienelactone hydrolase